MKTNVLGVQYDNVTMAEALDTARALLQRPEASYCVTPNAEMAYEALHDESFRAILNGASLVLPDGAGVVLGAKILRTPLQEKVAGIDFAANLLGVLEETGGRLYLLGGKPGIAEQAAENMKKTHPKLCICGTADGYFRDEAPVIARINEARADVVFVCLGCVLWCCIAMGTRKHCMLQAADVYFRSFPRIVCLNGRKIFLWRRIPMWRQYC